MRRAFVFLIMNVRKELLFCSSLCKDLKHYKHELGRTLVKSRRTRSESLKVGLKVKAVVHYATTAF
jgi:hypothetical protein